MYVVYHDWYTHTMTETILIVGIVILGLLNLATLIFLLRRQGGGTFQMLSQQLEHMRGIMDQRLGESTKQMHETVRSQFGDSQRLIQDISEQMTRHLKEVTKEMTESNKSSQQVLGIADKLQDLEKTLKHQKQRGNLGEASLELILSNILPPQAYKMQHRFENGEAVDAAIMTKEGIIPVDAKYSLDNYNRITNALDDVEKVRLEKLFKEDLKKRIDEVSKYIRPKEGTLPFAFMFIPAEGIYYDLLINEVGSHSSARNLIDYAYNDKKVIIVSPTTFAAYLQSVLYGFKAFKIEESAKLISKRVEDLARHLATYDEFFKKVGGALRTTVNHYNKADKELLKIDKDVLRITDESIGIDGMQIEKPDERDED